MLKNTDLNNIEGIGYFTVEGNTYITSWDLEKVAGIKRGTIRQYKKRDQLKPIIDYIKLNSCMMINIKSEFIHEKIEKNGKIKPLEIKQPYEGDFRISDYDEH